MPVKTRAAQKTKKQGNAKTSRTPVGSTVEGYTIPQVRKSLDLIRRSWGSRDEGSFSLMRHVSESDTIYTFGLRFMLGHHRKRHQRRAKKSASSS